MPIKTDPVTTLTLIRFFLLYAAKAESVVGNVAGNGEAKAAKGLIPAKICNAGVVIALPPLPTNPEKKPTTEPIIKMIALDE